VCTRGSNRALLCGPSTSPLGDMTIAPILLVVPEMTVRVATGQTCYPDENGFSAHWVEVSTADPSLVRTLATIARQDNRVLLRCAMFDVTGRVTKHEEENGVSRFVVSIEALTYRRPGYVSNVT
jgi:hypothetical protein